MIHVHQIIQGSNDWHEARQGKFTGSNAYKLLGTQGASEYAKAVRSGFKGNFYTKRGHILEDEAIEVYESITGASVLRPGYITNDAYPSCLYSPDGLDNQVLLEVKCFGPKPHMKIYNGEIEVKILAQIYFGMLICGKKVARLIIYNPDLEDPKLCFKIIEVKYNRNITNNFRHILGAGKATHA